MIRKFIQKIISESYEKDMEDIKAKEIKLLKNVLRTSYTNLLNGRNIEFNEAKFKYASRALKRAHNINPDDIISQTKLEFEKEQGQKNIKASMDLLGTNNTEELFSILIKNIQQLCLKKYSDQQNTEIKKEDKALEVSKITAALMLLKNQNITEDKVIKNINQTLYSMPDNYSYPALNHQELPQIDNFSFYTRINKEMIALYPRLGDMAKDFLVNLLILEMWFNTVRHEPKFYTNYKDLPKTRVKYITFCIMFYFVHRKGLQSKYYYRNGRIDTKYMFLLHLLETNGHLKLAQQYGLSMPNPTLLKEKFFMQKILQYVRRHHPN